jgi:hypothetical protein
MTHQLSAQLRAAEDRVRGLEAAVRYHQTGGTEPRSGCIESRSRSSSSSLAGRRGVTRSSHLLRRRSSAVSGNKRRQEPLRRPDLSTFFSRYSLIKRPSQQTISD